MGGVRGARTNARGATMRDEAVLVTGASGFIGRNLIRALRVSGATVFGIDDCSAPDARAHDRDAVDQGDILDLGVRDLAGVTTVVHLAARKSVPSSFENRDDIARNVLVDRHLVDIASRARVRRVLLASSCEVYGAQVVGVPINEDATFAPRSPYAVSKVALEYLADVYARTGAETTALRFFNVYGPDEGLEAVVPRFIADVQATGGVTVEDDGEQRRDFNYVDDVVDMLVQIIGYDRRLPRAINIGSGRSRSIAELAAIVLGLAGGGSVRAAPGRRNEIADFVACTRLLASLIDVRSRSLEAGVAACWAASVTGIDRQSA